eukprot:m.123016 g.123016  ORF g.123016 m.123016 type:complete len:435 (+) comp13742_c1_seq11:644-1948(+)
MEVSATDAPLDVLEHAMRETRATAEQLAELAQSDERVMEFCQHVCARLMAARSILSKHSQSNNQELLGTYVPFLQSALSKKTFQEKMLTSDVSISSALLCLHHLVKNTADTSPILAGVSAEALADELFPCLPQGDSEKQQTDMVVLAHARACQAPNCTEAFCSKTKQFLEEVDATANDTDNEEIRYVKQMERHFARCRNPECEVCADGRRAQQHAQMPSVVEEDTSSTTFSTRRIHFAPDVAQSTAGSRGASKERKVRPSRAVSMPPLPTIQTQANTSVATAFGTPMMSMAGPSQVMMPQNYPGFMMMPAPPMMSPGFGFVPPQMYSAFPMGMQPQQVQSPTQAHMQAHMQQQQQFQAPPVPAQSHVTRFKQRGRTKAHSAPPPMQSMMNTEEDDDDDDEEEEDDEEDVAEVVTVAPEVYDEGSEPKIEIIEDA